MGYFKIISGGQTGVDRIALEIAYKLGIDCGGTAPRGYLTEYGSDYTLSKFGLKEHKSNKYPPRTKSNIMDSDGTVYFATDTKSNGLKLTKKISNSNNKPFILNPTSEELEQWILNNCIKVLNVAGNRGSKLGESNENNINKLLTKTFTNFL